MKIISVEKDVSWAPLPNTRSWVIDDQIPPKELISSVFALTFNVNGKILLIKNKRGWGLPGGHVEKDESLEETLHREVKEEANCEIEILGPFGYQQIESRGEEPEGYKYPHPKGYVQYFLAELKTLELFDTKSEWRAEVEARRLFTLEEAKQTKGFKERLPFYQEAISKYQNNK